MKPKTCIVLSAISFGLRALSLIAVLGMSVFQTPIKRLFQSDPEILAVHTVPWPTIVSSVLALVLAGIILLVLANRPSRSGTIILTVVMVVLFGFSNIVMQPLMSFLFVQVINQKGRLEIASYSALTGAISMIYPLIDNPASIMSLLALGGACGKNFRSEA